MSSGSENTNAIPAINFKRYLGATGVRYINMGEASKIRINSDWDLEETVCQVEQKFATDLNTIAEEMSNDEKLLKTLVCIERKTMELLPEEYNEYTKTFINEIRCRVLRRQNNNPATIEKDKNHFTPQRKPGNQQNVHCSKAILVAESNKEIQNKCDECIPCKMVAQPETLQVYSFNNGDGEYDQLIMKAPLKGDVSIKFPDQFLEKKKTKQKQIRK